MNPFATAQIREVMKMKVLIDISKGNYETLQELADIDLGFYHELILDGEIISEMTNGEVIKTMFPNEEVIETDGGCVYFGAKMRFDKDLWNAPYKTEKWVNFAEELKDVFEEEEVDFADKCRECGARYGRYKDFCEYVAKMVLRDDFEENAGANAEFLCRKLSKLGIVKTDEDEWVLAESEVEENDRID